MCSGQRIQQLQADVRRCVLCCLLQPQQTAALCLWPRFPTANGRPAAPAPASVPAARPPVILVAAQLSAASLMGRGKGRQRAQGVVSVHGCGHVQVVLTCMQDREK
jgi:hypothetical protein